MRAELVAIMRKEFRQTFRDRRMAMILIAAPVLQLVLLGYAADLEVDGVRTAVCDADHTAQSRELADGLLADGTLHKVGDTEDPARPLEQGWAQVVLVLPRGLASDLAAGRPAEVQVLVDGTDSVRAEVAMATAQQYLQRRGLQLSEQRLRTSAMLQGRVLALPRLSLEPRIYYNPRLKSRIYMVPGVAAVALLVVTTIITAMGLAREKEMGTIEQLMITPMRPVVLLLGKTLPFALIGIVVAGLIISIGTNLFGVPVRGSLLCVFFGTVLYLLSTLGVGVFISTMARTQQQAILGGFFFLMPAILLSGFISPVESMPLWVQPLTWINPVRYFVEILRACLLKGAGIVDMAQQLFALLAFGVGILGVATLRFRKQLA